MSTEPIISSPASVSASMDRNLARCDIQIYRSILKYDLGGLDQRLFKNILPAVRTPCRGLQNVICHSRI